MLSKLPWDVKKQIPAWPNLLLVQLIPNQAIHVQEVLGHANARQVCQDSEVTGYAKFCQQGATVAA